MKTLLFVDDEPRLLQGLQRQLRPLRSEWDMNFIGDGRAALDLMATRPVDIIVSDMMMPGMDGMQLLGEVRQRHPQTVRIILSGQSGSEAIIRLVGPAHQYLSKPCNPDELRQAITRALALRDVLGNERLKQLATRIKNLPTLPALQNRLAEELEKESPSLECVGEIIAHDIALTAKVLQLVNSAFFCRAQPINNPVEAAVYLGLNTIQSLVLSTEIFSQADLRTCKSFSFEALARHSWLTGVLARNVAQLERQEVKIHEQCFLAGLLHDVGQLILASGLPGEYAEVIAQAKNQSRPLWQVEQEFFGATHADVGAYLLALWGLSNPITEAVALHHQPARCPTPGFSATMAVHAADVFAHEVFESGTEATAPGLDTAYLTGLGFGGRIETWRTETRKTLEPR